ncbi:MAG TPA: arsenate reductase (glutaredoxin) [Rhizomicrobium sp.]|nr:arsenate reductase (glutaredoxin) [Rhizomicrobium sp.]
MAITIYHNPKCGTSRQTLDLIRQAGHEPKIVEYLKTPLDKAGLKALVKKAGVPVREIVRAKEPLYGELQLDKAGDEKLFDAMVQHPILMNRPIVETATRAKLCRPPEAVKELI